MSKNNLNLLQKESEILTILKGKCVVRAVYSFTHETYLCFVMEYMHGGDLGVIIEKECRLDVYTARFYVAEII